jgi:hypothetical protein
MSGPSKIFPNFYVGSFEHAENEDIVIDLEITHILSVGSGALTSVPVTSERARNICSFGIHFKLIATGILDAR